MKNYYLILGVGLDATQREIRTAYRELAKALHPDYYGEDSGPFIDLKEAYAVLNDPIRRRTYDRSFRRTQHPSPSRRTRAEPLRPKGPQAEPLIPGSQSTDLDPMPPTKSFHSYSPSLDQIFDRLGRNYDRVKPKVENLESLNVEILLTPWEAQRGDRVRILVPARLRCPICRGRGVVGFFKCRRCAGQGIVS